MIYGGVIIAAFVVFHLADLTLGVEAANPDFVRGLPYENLVASFSRLPVAIFYIVANLLLGVHLYHGAWSMFQSVGVNNPRFNQWRRWFAYGVSAVIVIGNVVAWKQYNDALGSMGGDIALSASMARV